MVNSLKQLLSTYTGKVSIGEDVTTFGYLSFYKIEEAFLHDGIVSFGETIYSIEGTLDTSNDATCSLLQREIYKEEGATSFCTKDKKGSFIDKVNSVIVKEIRYDSLDKAEIELHVVSFNK